jgi:hypothetical protein
LSHHAINALSFTPLVSWPFSGCFLCDGCDDRETSLAQSSFTG